LYFRLKIQDIILLLYFIKDETEVGTYRIYDFFKNIFRLGYDDPDSDTPFYAPQYSALRIDDYIDLDNINYDCIITSYQALLEENPKIYSQANIDMLNILLAYDKSKKEKLLRLAEQMAEWIFESETDIVDYDIALLNKLQIAKRQRELSEDEILELCILTENNNTREDIKVGAYLLLGNQPAAQMHFDKLENNLQIAFKEYPIFYFWKLQKEDVQNG